ncbi:MAG: efflux RND transporter periplasmic adaptor subunit [Nitrospirae bacterium]|nr:efflux RND transporter periplasmic adaptor subunit [Nitrospirota bacterium]
MSRQTSIIVTVVIALAVLAGGAYTTRHKWMHAVSKGSPEESGGFNIVEKGGVRYKEIWTCPMHPQIIRPSPGDCPICGMSLVKKDVPLEGQAPAPGMDNMTGMGGTGTGLTHDELARVTLDPRQRMLANVATTEAVYGELSGDVYTVGRIQFDEQKLTKVSSRYAGRIERLYVDFTGATLKKGERVFSIYSPELVSTQKEYLIAKKSSERLRASEFPEVSRSTEGMLGAAHERLRLWGMTDAQIDELASTGAVRTAVDVYSPVSGTVVEVMAREGDYVSEGMVVYRVADLRRVWMLADVYEYEFTKVGLGSRVELTADAYPGRTFAGRVTFIDPVVDAESRTVKVRAEFDNPGGVLKPEMFVGARIFSKGRRALTIPASAVLYTGLRDVVWVESEPGAFEPRDVKLGLRSGDMYEVLEGLAAGDMVVSQGGFLIDSEAQLRASAGGGMAGMESGGEAPTKETPAGHRH